MRRLYQKIYLVFLASLIAVVVISGLSWRVGQANLPHGEVLELAGELAMAALPSLDAPRQVQQQAVERLSRRLRIDIALFDQNRAPIAVVGRPLPQPPSFGESGVWLRGRGGPAWSFRLPDGRWLVARTPLRPAGPLLGLVFFLAAMAIAIAIFAYPVVRGLTRRIERLQAGVETLGAGNLATRVAVEGRDEVARLAASFNRAAALIEEILLASRLDVAAAPPATEDVDLLALAAEECAHYDGCILDGELVVVRGDSRLLRRLLRNLLDNAQRHGKPPIRIELRRK